MKKLKLFIAALLLVAATSFTHAQDAEIDIHNFEPKPITTSFKVHGECNMCKSRIEKAVKITGVTSASWNVDNKELSLAYNPKVISIDKIHTLIAAVGHDTGKVKAEDKVYNALPGCCHYQRKL
ncbi:MAG: cation transporter [Chitinophagaceae bacterium]